MTTPTLAEPLDEWECCCKYDTCTNACAPLVAHLKQRIDAIDKVNVPEPLGYFEPITKSFMSVADFASNPFANPGDWHLIYGPEVIDALRRGTVLADRAAKMAQGNYELYKRTISELEKAESELAESNADLEIAIKDTAHAVKMREKAEAERDALLKKYAEQWNKAEELRKRADEYRDNGQRLLEAADGWKLRAEKAEADLAAARQGETEAVKLLARAQGYVAREGDKRLSSEITTALASAQNAPSAPAAETVAVLRETLQEWRDFFNHYSMCCEDEQGDMREQLDATLASMLAAAKEETK